VGFAGIVGDGGMAVAEGGAGDGDGTGRVGVGGALAGVRVTNDVAKAGAIGDGLLAEVGSADVTGGVLLPAVTIGVAVEPTKRSPKRNNPNSARTITPNNATTPIRIAFAGEGEPRRRESNGNGFGATPPEVSTPGAALPAAVPQRGQNRAPGSIGEPHAPQYNSTSVSRTTARHYRRAPFH
jgi:hypothetical protein